MKINQIEPLLTGLESTALQNYFSTGGWLTEHTKTKEFERKIAKYVGVRYASVVPNGTIALYLALLSAGIGNGDVVAVPNYTMIATINAIKWTGAEPLICDIDSETLCINIDNLESSCKELKAIMHVSINGRSGDINKVLDFCNRRNIILIEDSAQAMGSRFNNQFLGTFGDMGVYSFTPHKIITTGQGGVIVTNNLSFYKKIESLKDFGRIENGVDIHEEVGYNFKFTDLQSVVGLEQIKTIKDRVKRKKEMYALYRSKLKHINCIQFIDTDLEQVTPWSVDIILSSEGVRDRLKNFLSSEGIGSRSFYPAINSQKPYLYFKKGSFPVSESIVNRGLWLPSSLGLNDNDISFICNKIENFFNFST